MTKAHISPLSSTSEQGSALIIGLLLLLVMTIIGLSLMQSTVLEERMSGNMKDRNLAFQAAEAALRDAEQVLRSDTDGPFTPFQESAFTADCTNGLCRSTPSTPIWSTLSQSDWTGAKTWGYGGTTGAAALPSVISQPRYLIEYQGFQQAFDPGMPCVALFLISASASGSNTNTSVILQTLYRHRSGECYPSI